MIRHLIFLTEPAIIKKDYSTFGSGLELFGLIVLFIFIIIASYFVTKFVASRQLGLQGESNFKVIDTYRITQNKVIQLLRVGNKYIVIAICKDSITMLTELSEDQVTDFKSKNNSSKNFKDILAGLTKNKETKIEKVDIHEDDY